MRRALTLLEVLLALVLTATVSVIVAGWIGIQSRAVMAQVRSAERTQALRITLRVLNDDLRGAAGSDGVPTVSKDGRSLVFTTLATQPGDAPGLKPVTWRFAAQGNLLERVSDDRARPITAHLQAGHFQADQRGHVHLAVTQDGVVQTIALWSNH